MDVEQATDSPSSRATDIANTHATSPNPALRETSMDPCLATTRGSVKQDYATNTEDPDLVIWDSSHDPANPRHWPKHVKWTTTILISAFTFISPISSSILAPAISQMSEHFGVRRAMGQMMLSSFVLAYAVGPLVTGPLSEIYGRVVVLQLWNLLFLVFNSACVGASNVRMLIAFRFLAGLGSSAPFAIGGGMMSDIWRVEERGTAVAVYTLMPLIGPALGPICGGFITHYSDWRYCFVATSAANAIVQLLGLVLLHETYPPTILHRKAKKLRKATGNAALHTEYEVPAHSRIKHVATALARPFRLLTTQAIVQILALYMGVLNGSLYLVLASFPLVWHDRYKQQISIASLNYISIGLGFALGAQVSAFFQDRIYRRLSNHYTTEGKPEFRIPLMIPASIISPFGLLLYGWAAAARFHWVLPNLGALLFAAGVGIGFQGIQIFLIDAYPRYAASAVGAVIVLRSVGGFAFPLFAPDLFEHLGFGKGGTILAGALLAIGLPGAVGLWVWGEKLRGKSKFAAGGEFEE